MNDMVTIPRAEYERLCAAAEDLADLKTFDAAKAALAAGEDELIPDAYVQRLLSGESSLRVYRELRGLTQAELAAQSGVHRVTIAEIETGRKRGSLEAMRNLARSLDVSLDDLAG